MRSGVAPSPFWMRIRLTTGWKRAGRSEDADEVLEAPEEGPGAAGRRLGDSATLGMPEEVATGTEEVVEGESAAHLRREAHGLLGKHLEEREREGGVGEAADRLDGPLEAPPRRVDGEELEEAADPHLLDLAFAGEAVGVFQEAEGTEELHPPRRLQPSTPVSPSRWRRSHSVGQGLQP